MNSARDMLSYLRSHARIDRGDVMLLGSWSLIEAIPVLLSGWLIARAVDHGFLARNTGLGLALLALYGVLELGRAFAERQLMPILAEVVEPLRDALVGSVVASAVSQAVERPGSHSSEPDSAVAARLTGHVEVVRNLLNALLRVSRPLFISIFSALIGLATVAPGLLVAVLPPVVLAALIYPVSWRAVNRRRNAAVLAEEQVAAVTGQTVRGMRDIIATGGSARAITEVAAVTRAEVRARNALTRLVGIRVAIDTLGGRVPLLGTLVIAPVLIRHNALTAGQLLGAITYLTGYLTPAVTTFNGALSTYSTQLSAVVERLRQTAPATSYNSVPETVPTATTGQQASIPAVHVSGVHFSYGGAGSPVLQDLNLTIPAGDHLAIVGSSGAGKSTLASILAGVDRPDQGSVLIGEQAAHDAWTARRTALVPQASYLIADTLWANLTYLNHAVSTDQLDHAVRELAVTGLVRRLGGYQAEIRPDQLSRGEQQLIVLARVYLSSAVLVVLDEATSHLDPGHEHLIEQAFSRRPGTLVVVAHRITAAARARQVLLLGVQPPLLGDHEDLLTRSTNYAALVDGVSHRRRRPATTVS